MARYGTDHKRATRRRILEAAGRRLKRDGIEGSGVATLMADGRDRLLPPEQQVEDDRRHDGEDDRRPDGDEDLGVLPTEGEVPGQPAQAQGAGGEEQQPTTTSTAAATSRNFPTVPTSITPP